MARSKTTSVSLPDIGKPLLLLASFVLSLPAVWERIVALGSVDKIAGFVMLMIVMWIGVIGAAWSRLMIMRVMWGVLLSGGLVLMDSYRFASGQFMTYDAFITMLQSAAFAGDAARQNIGALMASGVPAIILGLGIILPPKPHLPLPWIISMLLAPLAFIALTVILFTRGGDGGRGLPQGMTATSYLALAGYEAMNDDTGPRKPPLFEHKGDRAVRNIVLVIDESIAANYLAANAQGGVQTPLSAPPEGIAVHNFGIAAAVTTCSTGTNVALRYGGTRDRYKRMIAEYPSLWAYAKQAGMRTVYIDAQRDGGKLHNGMNAAERAEIDSFIQFDGAAIDDRDMRVAAKLADLTRSPGAKFIIVNKVGAHFPIQNKYPLSAMTHTPSLQGGGFADVADTGSRVGFGGSADEWRLYRNSYRNAIGWNVGTFMDRLFAEGAFDDTLMIYTADHGQNLHEDGSAGTTTHCSADPKMAEAAVPLFVIEGAENPSGKAWRASAEQNHDKSSHFMIAPTLLAAMGYDAGAVRRAYGGSLTQPSRDPGIFVVDFNARLGRQPEWRKLDTVSVPKPPRTD